MRFAALLGCIAITGTVVPAPATRCGIDMRNTALHLADGVVLRKGLQVFMPDYSRVRANGAILGPPRLP